MEKIKRYKNGLKLIVKKSSGLLSVACGVFVGVGSSKENEKTNGYSHIIEHMVFKGTKTRTAKQISEEMDELGGNLNAFTGKETTCFYTKVVPENLEKSVDFLSDLYFNAVFDKNDLEKEKTVIAEELLMDEDMPDDVCHDLIAKAFYGDIALGQKVIGTKENIKNATREDLLDFMQKHYVPSNTCVCFAGNIDFEVAEALTDKYFAENFKQTYIVVPKLEVLPLKKSFLTAFKDSEQSHISIAFNSCAFDDDDGYLVRAISTAFGGGMSSRLFQTIREQNGLAYSVFSGISSYVNNGYLELYLGTSPKNVKKAVDLLLDEVLKLKKDGLTQKELQRAKIQAKTNYAFSFESSLSMMIAYGTYMLLFDKSFAAEKRLKILDGITIDDVNKVIPKFFDFDTAAAVYVGRKCDDAQYPSIFVGYKN